MRQIKKKGSIEFSTQQIIILILMILIAVIIILLGVKYGDQVKSFIGKLFTASESAA